MRACLCLLLIGVLACCRFWCAASACDAHTTHDSPSQSSPHAVNDDDCLCNGGLKPEPASSLQKTSLSSDWLLCPVDISGPEISPLLPVSLASLNSSPAIRPPTPERFQILRL